ncbi:MAG: hypothetical protein RR388_09530, partial [Rikenellaceae bacterium]
PSQEVKVADIIIDYISQLKISTIMSITRNRSTIPIVIYKPTTKCVPAPDLTELDGESITIHPSELEKNAEFLLKSP